MDQQNQTNEPSEQTPFKGIHTVSENAFNKWTLKWYQQLANPQALLLSFKNIQQLMLKQVYFNDATVQNLLSSVGIENIHAKFVIADEYELYDITAPTFTIVLYATDTEGKRCSAYHLGKPQYHYQFSLTSTTPTSDTCDCISDFLAAKWVKAWENVIADPSKFSDRLFLTSYGFLNGYNYPMSDFMYALYPPGDKIQNYDIAILMGIHEYTIHNYLEQQVTKRTFGLVVAGVIQGPSATRAEDVNSYYDLSLPSPPNH